MPANGMISSQMEPIWVTRKYQMVRSFKVKAWSNDMGAEENELLNTGDWSIKVVSEDRTMTITINYTVEVSND